MANKIRHIYKGIQPVDTATVGTREPLFICVGDKVVYSKQESCTITISYGTTTFTLKEYKGNTLNDAITKLTSFTDANVNNAVVGKHLTQWSITNNNVPSTVTPTSLSDTVNCLKNIVVNGDVIITGLYGNTQCVLSIYDYSHTTVVQTITVDYNTTIQSALSAFNVNTLPAPSTINTKKETYSHNGWTKTQGEETQSTDLATTYITGPTSIYPLYTTSYIPYKMSFYKYDYNNDEYINVGTITIYYDESINSAIKRDEEDYLTSIETENFSSATVFHYTNALYYSSDFSLDPMTRDTKLSSIPEKYLKSNMIVYIGYDVIVKTYSVKLKDLLSGNYLYQNTEVIHGTILENIETISPIITKVKEEDYQSTDENAHYNYYYWLEYADGTEYDTTKLTSVTNNIELYIRYTAFPITYGIDFAKGTSMTDYDEFDSVSVKYDVNFGLSDKAKALIADPVYVKDSTDYIITYNQIYQSTLDSSRKMYDTTILKCIGNETFVTTEASRTTKTTLVKTYINSTSGTLYSSNNMVTGTSYSLATIIAKAFNYQTSTTSAGVITKTVTDYVLVTLVPHTFSTSGKYTDYKVTSIGDFPISTTSGYESITIVIKTKVVTEAVQCLVTYTNSDMQTTFWSTRVAYGTKFKDIPRPTGIPKDAGTDVFKWWSAHGTGINIDTQGDYGVYSDMYIYPCYELNQTVEGNYPTASGIHIYNPTSKLWTLLLDYNDTTFTSRTIEASTDADFVIFTVYATGLILDNASYAKVSGGSEVVYGTTSLGTGYHGLRGRLPSSTTAITSYAEPVLYSHGPGEYTNQMTVKVYLKNTSFNDLVKGESATYDLSINVPDGVGGYITTDGYNYNTASVKLKVTKTDRAQVGGGD